MNDTCVCRGAVIPEGSHVCPNCQVAVEREDAYSFLVKHMNLPKEPQQNKKKAKLKQHLWLTNGDMSIGYDTIPERKKPVFGIMTGNTFVVYGQLRDEESAEEFMEKLADFFGVERSAEDDNTRT